MLFIYLHSQNNSDTPQFCSECLCADAIADFMNENFVAWGGSIRGLEGFKMSNSLKAQVPLLCRCHGIHQLEDCPAPTGTLPIYEDLKKYLFEAGCYVDESWTSLKSIPANWQG